MSGSALSPAGRSDTSSDDSLMEADEEPRAAADRPTRAFTQQQRIDAEQRYYERMSLDEKRTHYACGTKYVRLDELERWPDYYKKHELEPAEEESWDWQVRPELNGKVALWGPRADITRLEAAAIVNAANSALRGGGGVDGAIQSAAGRALSDAGATLAPCATGDAKITAGFRLPAKYVIHTVGPMGENAAALTSCYEQSLRLAAKHNLRSIAFPCISTGIYGYSNVKAARVAISAVRKWLQTADNSEKVDVVVFCLFEQKDVKIYERFTPHYFPIE